HCYYTVILRSISISLFNATATTDIYTLSLHDALPISPRAAEGGVEAMLIERLLQRLGLHDVGVQLRAMGEGAQPQAQPLRVHVRSEEHTSELQSQSNLVCRLLLEKKKK